MGSCSLKPLEPYLALIQNMVNFFPYDRYDFDLEMVDQLSLKLLNMEGRCKIMQLPVIK